MKIYFYPTLQESLDRLKQEQYEVFLMDTKAEKYPHEMRASSKIVPLFLWNEEVGPILDWCRKIINLRMTKIQQWGLTESLNVSIAASISSYEYVTPAI